MLFNKNPKVKSPYIENIGLSQVPCIKFLGVKIDSELSWSPHYNDLVLKIKWNMHMLKQGNKFLTPNAKRNIYYGHIYSHLTYCISTWGPMLQSARIKKLQKITK